MRHGVAGRKFDRPTGPRQMMYRNLMTAVLRYERIKTTEAKAKEIRPMVERLITLAKTDIDTVDFSLSKQQRAEQQKDTPKRLHARRRAIAQLTDVKIVEKLFDVMAPRFAERPGGYTRIVKLGPRQGDAAPMVYLELVD